MPISKDEFRTIGEDESPLPDLSPDTTQGRVYRFLLAHADRAFRQREIVDGVDVPKGSVGPTLKRLERRGLVEHRDRFWAIADAEHAVAASGLHGAASADAVDGGFSDADVETWMDAAVDPIEGDDGGGNRDGNVDGSDRGEGDGGGDGADDGNGDGGGTADAVGDATGDSRGDGAGDDGADGRAE